MDEATLTDKVPEATAEPGVNPIGAGLQNGPEASKGGDGCRKPGSSWETENVRAL